MLENIDFDPTITELGVRRHTNPMSGDTWTEDGNRILVDVSQDYFEKVRAEGRAPLTVELAGAREKLFFDPHNTRAAIVTCGGICPGLNDVIRALVMTLYHSYGCRDILGIRYGYEGLTLKHDHEPLALTPELVDKIHEMGGSILSSSRGHQETPEIVDFMEDKGIDILFTIGGDGTLRGAHEIAQEILARGIKRSVVGIPKTIDNDVNNVAKSFGFETAFSAASQAIRAAHVEAKGARNGIGIVKLMGRNSGFIAANATLANRDVNFCLVPEVDFDLDGDAGLLAELKRRIIKRGHAVVVVAEGAGQKFFKDMELGTDKSGNKLNGDIGLYLKDRIADYFAEHRIEGSIKYIDPSYIIRSVPATPNDSVFCGFLGQMAVHAAMAGKTDMIVAVWNNMFTHLPIAAAVGNKKYIDPRRKLWLSVLQTTGQPRLKND